MSLNRFAAAEEALKAGPFETALAMIESELNADPNAPAAIFRNLGGMLLRRKMYAKAETWLQVGAAQYPKDAEILNGLGVALRRLQRPSEAIAVFDRGLKLNPKNEALLMNKGNVYNDIRDPSAVPIFSKLVRNKPQDAELNRNLGRAYWFAGDTTKALQRFNLATKLKPTLRDAWLDLSSLTSDLEGPVAALEVIDRAIAAAPDDLKYLETKAILVRRTGRLREAEEFLTELNDRHPDVDWIHYQLGSSITDYDRGRANHHLEEAVRLAPDNALYKVALAESLGRSRFGDEAAHLDRAYQIIMSVFDNLPDDAGTLKVAYELTNRLADYDAFDRLGDFKTIGRAWADSGRHTALLIHLARVDSDDDRLELVEEHRIWGRKAEATGARHPIIHPAPRRDNGKIRLGFMSSDLRAHPVAYFAMPLFEHYDRDRFEIYCYSFFQGAEDSSQRHITKQVDVFRWQRDISDREAAQLIAEDQLDMLIELGGSTHMNKLGAMAFKPAPLTASWLGYPHSAGLESIDHLILDPYVTPPDTRLVIEEPLLMPRSWIVMGELAFPDRQIEPIIPQKRNGYLTIGTANNPYKYGRKMIQAWAEVTAAIPDAHFMFVRPEAGSPTFRRNLLKYFTDAGVAEERVRFEAVRGQHMPFYNEMDMSLDSFPQTGGTTTCEALWMGVPVVTLVGPAIFERLSYSILTNAGLGDLCAHTVEEFTDVALRLAADEDRRQNLRTGLRTQLRASPLGRTRQFAADFYDMIERAVTSARASGKIKVAA